MSVVTVLIRVAEVLPHDSILPGCSTVEALETMEPDTPPQPRLSFLCEAAASLVEVTRV